MACKHLLKAELLLATELKWDQCIIFFFDLQREESLVKSFIIHHLTQNGTVQLQ